MTKYQKTGGVFALLFSLSLLMFLAQHLGEKVENFSFARSDSDAWNFAQVEVAYDRVQLALKEALIEVQANGELSSELETDIVKQFDIFYSRVGTVADRYDMFEGKPQVREILGAVELARDRLASMIDVGQIKTVPQLRAILEISGNFRPDIRQFALAAMHEAIGDQERERIEVYSSLRNATLILTGVMSFLLVMGAVLAYLWRTLAKKNATERNLSTFLEKLLDVSSDGIVVIDEYLRITQVNRKAERTFGYDRAALIGCDVLCKLGPQRRRGNMADLFRSLLDGKLDPETDLRRMPVVVRRASGVLFPAELSVVRVRDRSRRKVLVGFVRDLSSERQARLITRRALAQARNDAAAKQRFLATMSHEMRTPLHSIVVAADLAQRSETASESRENLPIIRAAAQTALDQVEDILEIATNGGKSPKEPAKDFDALAIARSVFLQMKPLAQARGNQLLFDWDGPAILRGVPRNLFKVIYNLVSNAIKATQHGTVTIRASKSGLRGQLAVRVEVADTGCGISEADKAGLFDDFVSGFKGHASDKSGTGLGLGIVKRALEAMGGQITFESTVGQGTVFRATIPLSQDGAAPDQPVVSLPVRAPAPRLPIVQQEGGPIAHGKVLLIEDHATNRRLLEHMLVNAGYRVTTACDGLLGLEKAVEERFDIVLTDINMPRLSGDKVARCLRHSRLSSDCCVIAVTAKATLSMEQKAQIIDWGVDAFLYKPFDSARLGEVIRDAVEEHEFHTPQDQGDPVDADLAITSEFLVQAAQDMQELLTLMSHIAGPDVGDAAITALGKHAHYAAGGLLCMGQQRLGSALLDIERMCEQRDLDCLNGMTVVLGPEVERVRSDISLQVAQI